MSVELSKKEGGGDRGGLAVRREEREINDPGLPRSGGGSGHPSPPSDLLLQITALSLSLSSPLTEKVIDL